MTDKKFYQGIGWKLKTVLQRNNKNKTIFIKVLSSKFDSTIGLWLKQNT